MFCRPELLTFGEPECQVTLLLMPETSMVSAVSMVTTFCMPVTASVVQ